MDLILRRNTAMSYEDDTDELIMRTIKKVNTPVTTIGDFAFTNCTQLEEINAPNATSIKQYGFYNCNHLESVNAPKCSGLSDYEFYGCSKLDNFESPRLKINNNKLNTNIWTIPQYCFYGCNGFTTLFLDSPTINTYAAASTSVVTGVLAKVTSRISYTFSGCNKLETADLFMYGGDLSTYVFRSCTNLSTLILRKYSGIVALQGGVNVFNNTPFASGGAGGTIYIPKALYDHLGDGTDLDYKAASNWSTVDGYGTITWAQIEGSQYENYYADGTEIPQLLRFTNGSYLNGTVVVSNGNHVEYNAPTNGSQVDLLFTSPVTINKGDKIWMIFVGTTTTSKNRTISFLIDGEPQYIGTTSPGLNTFYSYTADKSGSFSGIRYKANANGLVASHDVLIQVTNALS